MDEIPSVYDGYRAHIKRLLDEIEQQPNGGARGALAFGIRKARETGEPLEKEVPALAHRRDLIDPGERILHHLANADEDSHVTTSQVDELEAMIQDRLDVIARELREQRERHLRALNPDYEQDPG